MKDVLIGLIALSSVSVVAGDIIKHPKVAGLQINCTSNMDAVCKHLGFKESVEFACKSPLRTLFIGAGQDIQNGKSVNIKLKSCNDNGTGISAADAMNSVEIKCETYAAYANESKKTKILKSIKCE